MNEGPAQPVSSEADTPDPSPPEALPPDRLELPLMAYHVELLQYFQTEEAGLWDWFASHPVRQQHVEDRKLELLRSTLRLERETSPKLYGLADDLTARMQMSLPVTLYHTQQHEPLNAHIAWMPDEIHIVLHGPMEETLSDAEMFALLAHELAHHELCCRNDGACGIAEQLLSGLLTDDSSGPAHARTWSSFRMYSELYCDRRALDLTDSLQDVVRMLVKVTTGRQHASAEDYLKQAGEILAQSSRPSDGIDHPETWIRARALQLWQETPEQAEVTIRPLIEGDWTMNELDLLRQKSLTGYTRQLLEAFLAPQWLQTSVNMGHMRRFFPDYDWRPEPNTDVAVLQASGREWKPDQLGESLQRYLCCLLLDFVTMDPDLEDAPLAAAFLFAEQWQLSSFPDVAAKELHLGKRQFQRIRNDAAQIVAAAAEEPAE